MVKRRKHQSQCSLPWIYQNTFKSTVGALSLHGLEFKDLEIKEDKELNALGDEVCAVVSSVRGFKTDNKISLKTELEKVVVETANPDFVLGSKGDILDATCARELVVNKGKTLSVNVEGIIDTPRE